MRQIGVLLVAGMLSLGNVYAAALLSEQQARARAINVLKGDPYGTTTNDVAKNIRQAALLQNGKTKVCGAQRRPVWEFHIVVATPNKDRFNNGVIDGYLVLDARTGQMLCANLPMLD